MSYPAWTDKQNMIDWVSNWQKFIFSVWSGSGEISLSGLQVTAFWLCPHVAERESKFSGVSFYKGTYHIKRKPYLMTSCKPHCLLKSMSPNPTALGLGLQYIHLRNTFQRRKYILPHCILFSFPLFLSSFSLPFLPSLSLFLSCLPVLFSFHIFLCWKFFKQ